MDFNVRLYEPSLVSPAHHQSTNDCNHSQDVYFLSNFDQVVACIMETVFCFKSSHEMSKENPAKVIREALKKVLVFYYPLAGRLKMSPEGKLYVQCTGEGAMFVEAEADCCLADIASRVTEPDLSTLRRLVYNVPSAGTNGLLMPPLVVQVTRFKCGGLVLGVVTNHVLCDGFSTMEFLNSWTEIARGAEAPSVPPFLDRTLLRPRSPPTVEFPHLEYANIEDVTTMEEEVKAYAYRYFSFSDENVDELKKLAMEDGVLSKCTSFQVISAHVWRCRTKALGVESNQQIKLLFVMNVRERFVPSLPKGYFGNGVFHPYAACTAGELLENGLSFGVGLIQNAMERVTDRYLRSAIDYLEITRGELPLNNILEITTWSRLPLGTLDFGWGKPVQYGPASPPPHKDFVTLVSHGKGKSIDVLVGLPPRSMTLFNKYIRI